MATTDQGPIEVTPPGEVRVRRALLTVSDKRGLVEFARGLADLGVEIVSTGGTARELEGAGIGVRAIDDYTGFPEILDGRGKTLNPRIYAGLLAGRSNPGHAPHPSQRGGAGGGAPDPGARPPAPGPGMRADRPRMRDPLPVRAPGRPPR